MLIQFITTGGTIDKIYFDALSQFEVGESQVEHILREGLVQVDYRVVPLLRKDSLEMTDEDRELVLDAVAGCGGDRILITHGTDTMAETAQALSSLSDKTIVFTGAMQPARMRRSDAVFNIGFAWAAVQLLSPGVYIAMNGEVFEAGAVRKNLKAQRFERT